VLETCADAAAASASTIRERSIFIGINLCQILTPGWAKVAGRKLATPSGTPSPIDVLMMGI